jgi:hypothetical protein
MFGRSLAAGAQWPDLVQKQSQFWQPVIDVQFQGDIEILDR